MHSQTSTTGLLAIPKKSTSSSRSMKRINLGGGVQSFQPTTAAGISALIQKAPLTLRPFAALYNPFSKGCSVLCNHPATVEIKNVVKQAKQSWKSEGIATGDNYKSNPYDSIHRHVMESGVDFEYGDRDGRQKSSRVIKIIDYDDIHGHVPEEFLRRFTDSDSRPLTPTPTIVSNKTRASINSIKNSRRCVTPEPKNVYSNEKKQLILDLRRSHSQETMFWNASSELSPSGPDWLARSTSPPKTAKRQESSAYSFSSPPPAPLASRVAQPSQRTTSQDAQDPKQISKQLSCIYSKEELDDEPRRRGKKKKRTKNQQDTTTFRPNQDPETQIATLTPDSTNQSQRTSLVANEALLMSQHQKPAKSTRSSIDQKESRSASFLDENLLNQLRRGLSIDVIENNFRTLMHMALKEAMRNIPILEKGHGSSSNRASASMAKGGAGGGTGAGAGEPDAIRSVRETLNLPEVDHEKWLTLPRKYTRMVSRFELPIDSTELSRLSPIDYLSKYVQVSNYRKQLYHRIFVKFIPDVKIDDFGEINMTSADATISSSLGDLDRATATTSIADLYIGKRFIGLEYLTEALTTALHPNGTDEVIESIMNLLSITDTVWNEHHQQRQRQSDSVGSLAHKQRCNGFDKSDKNNGFRADNDVGILPQMSDVTAGHENSPNDDADNGSPNGKFNIRRSAADDDGEIDNDNVAASNDTMIKSGQKGIRSQDNHKWQAGVNGGVHLFSSAPTSTPSFHHLLGNNKTNDELSRNQIRINFRTWCGIVAFAERLTTKIRQEQDARHEIEITDFESLDRRLNEIAVHPKLKELLYIIKN